MRTTKSGGKKTPQAKKDAAAAATVSAEKTPETTAVATAKATPKSGGRTTRSAGKQSAPRTSAAPAAGVNPAISPAASTQPDTTTPSALATPDAKIVKTVGETAPISVGTKVTPTTKSPEKAASKNKSPASSSKELSEKEYVEFTMADMGATKVVESEKPAFPNNKEEDKSVLSCTEGKMGTQENAAVDGGTKKKEEKGSAVLEIGNGDGETFARKEEKSAEKAAAPENMMEENDEQVDGDEDEDLEGEEGEDEEDVDEEEVGLKEEEQMEMSDMVKERKKKKETEVFLGGLDRDATEEDVRKAFEKIGVVEEVRLHMDFTTNKNKGFAFVKFADKEQVNKVLSELKNPIIRGKRCGIAASEDNDTLFLGNICNTWTKEAIKRRLKEFGVEGLENITLVEDTQHEGLSRGFAFLEFSCHEFAMNGYKRLQKPDAIFGHTEWSAKVAFAEPLREPDAEVMAQVKSVFVDGMPPYWDEDRVKEQFKEYGEIERVVLARNMPTAKRKDFGFVNFTTHESAVACVEEINNTELGDGKSKTKARARLANPLPKTQAVKGGIRGGFHIGRSNTGFFPRFAGRGFGRARAPFARAGFHGARGFPVRGHGRDGRFSFPHNNMESSRYDFRGRRPFGVRGGGFRGPFRSQYGGMGNEVPPRSDIGRSRRGFFDGGRGRPFQMRREPFASESDFGPFDDGHFAEDPYYYGDVGHGVKRPFSTMEHDTGYFETGSRVRPRYDLGDPLSTSARYRDSMGSSGGLYPRDYYGSDYGGSEYSSFYGGEGSGGGFYY